MKIFLLSILTLCGVSVFAQINSVTTFSGNTYNGVVEGAGLQNAYRTPSGLAKDSQGNIFLVDFTANNIRKITPAGVSTVFAGSTTSVSGTQNGVGVNALFFQPYDIAIDASDNIYVTDRGNHTIRQINSTGSVTTLAGSAGTSGYLSGSIPFFFNQPQGIDVLPNGNLIIADRGNKIVRIITNSGAHVATYGIPGTATGVDGNIGTATFTDPADVKAISNTEFYVAESNSNKIRKINTTTGTITTFAGTGTASSVDGALLSASFNSPSSIEYDGSSFYIADRSGHCIRKISGGQVITFAGSTPNQGFRNGNATDASFNTPSSLLLLNPNQLFIADWGNYRLRKITFGDFCANATVISGNSGTQNIGLINEGVPDVQCGVSNQYFDANAKWFQYTPTQNGLLTISANTPQNATTVNTLLTFLYQPSNLCTNMTCYAFNNNISATDLRSELVDLDVVAGTTYYIVWSDFYTDNQVVNFNYSFTPTNCLSLSALNVATENTENTINLAWQAPLGGTTPISYTLEIGPLNYAMGTAAALQTTTVNGNTVSFNGLTASTFYDIYIKSNCSATESSIWLGPFRINTEFSSAPLTYTQNFDTNTNFLNLGFNRFSSNTNSRFTSYNSGPNTLTQSGANSVYSFMDKTTTSESLIFSRKVSLVAGNIYKLSYYARTLLSSGSVPATVSGIIKTFVTPNNNYFNQGQHTQLLSTAANSLTTNFDLFEVNYTPTTSGEYRFGVENNGAFSGLVGSSAALYLDTFVISTVLSVQDFNKTNLSLYPNPVLDFVSIENPDNIQINAVSVIDMNGRELLNNKYTNTNNTVNLSNLSKGIYFIQLDTEKGILSKKIIKE